MFYYFNLIITLAKRNLQPPNKYLAKENIGAVVINVLIILVIIGLGIYPQPIAQLIQSL
jgi:NADH:ubiquinone oxidoreductase subunit 4 (subunit M)